MSMIVLLVAAVGLIIVVGGVIALVFALKGKDRDER